MDFESFCDHAACGRLAIVEQMLESGELVVSVDAHRALVRAAENGHVDVVACLLLRHAMFDPSADDNRAVRLAARNGHLAVVERLLQDERVDPAADSNYAVRWAAFYGRTAVVERLLRDVRVDPSANNNQAVSWAAEQGQLVVVERLLQDKRIDPSADNNYAVRWAACKGHRAIVERLLQDERVDPSADYNRAVTGAAVYGHFAVVERLLEDDRVDVAVAIRLSRPEHRKRFECRKRLTEICIALQAMQLPAWVTIKILRAARPWSTLPLHSKWSLVCTIKHFRDKTAKWTLSRSVIMPPAVDWQLWSRCSNPASWLSV